MQTFPVKFRLSREIPLVMSFLAVSTFAFQVKVAPRPGLLCKGSAFAVSHFSNIFILTTLHVAKPHLYPSLFRSAAPNQAGSDHSAARMHHFLSMLRDRHLSHAVERYDRRGFPYATLPVDEAAIQAAPNALDVAILRIDGETDLMARMQEDGLPPLTPFEVDAMKDNGIKKNEELIICGLDQAPRRSRDGEIIPHDSLDNRRLVRYVKATAVGAYKNSNAGTVLLASTGYERCSALMSGGPVIRPATGKVVGVFVAPTVTKAEDPSVLDAPPTPTDNLFRRMPLGTEKNRGAVVDLSSQPELGARIEHEGAAFVPILEFYEHLKNNLETE